MGGGPYPTPHQSHVALTVAIVAGPEPWDAQPIRVRVRVRPEPWDAQPGIHRCWEDRHTSDDLEGTAPAEARCSSDALHDQAE